MNQCCPLRMAAQRWPGAGGLITKTGATCFQELDEAAGRVQTWLRKQGFRSGEVLALSAEASGEWLPWLFACFREGVVLCPLNLRLPEKQQQQRVLESGARLHLTQFPELPAEAVHEAELDPAQAATLIFSSGSSGLAKGILHSLSAHIASAQGMLACFPMSPGDRWWASLPFYHVGGLAILFRCVLSGAAVSFVESGNTHVSWVPTQLQRAMAGSCPPELKRVFLGGAAVSEELVRRGRALGWPLTRSYGMTESASMICAVPPDAEEEEQATTDGRVLPHRELRVGDHSELMFRGDILPLRILKEGEWSLPGDEQGWLSTGDCGRVEQGRLRVEGRMDFQFISGGENIQPEQIERLLAQICGVTVVVLPRPDPEFGQLPFAFVDLPEGEWDVSGWERALRLELPGYMIPRGYAELPKSPGLKVDRRKLIPFLPKE